MLDNMNNILSRINQLKKRFGFMPDKSKVINKPKVDFSVQLKSSIDKYNSAKNVSPLEIKNIANVLARQEGVSPGLVNAVIKTESNYQPNAMSRKGAKGLMQLMPQMAKKMGVGNIFSPVENIQGGVKLLKQLLGKYDGDYKKALAAYNAGEPAVDKSNGIPPYKETQIYVKKVMDAYMRHSK